jgi:phosphoesterase RecJ-like protein
MVGKLLFKFNKNHVTKDVAKYLYLGIQTDTGRFLYPSTKPSTLKMASKLLKAGFDITEVNNSIFLRPYNDAKFSSYLLSISKINSNGFAYFVIPKNAFEKFNIKSANSFVNVLGGIKEVKI